MNAVYPGTFDPLTNGHIDIISRAKRIFTELVVAVVKNPEKSAMFSAEDRKKMIMESVPGVKVEIFSGLLVDYLKEKGIRFMIRGLRAISDFEYEFQLATINKELDPSIETVFFMTDKANFYLSSSAVKTISKNGGDVSRFVPEPVARRLKR